MKTDEPVVPTESAEASSSTPAKPKRKPEATTDRLSNLSRVTPAQLPFITFAPDARWTPVRPVNAAVAAPQPGLAPTIGAGGGILLMRDREPDKEAEWITIEVEKVLTLEDVDAAAAAAEGQAEVDFATAPIADPPAPFEFSTWD